MHTNQITDKGAACFALRENTTLKHFYLQNNQITNDGARRSC